MASRRRFAGAGARTPQGGPPGRRLKIVWGIPFKGKINVHCIHLARGNGLSRPGGNLGPRG